VLTGLFVVAAALVTAYATTRGPQILQHEQNRREDQRELAQARGAARILYGELEQAAFQIQVLGSDRILRRFDPSYEIAVEPGDMRLVASHVSGDEWGDISITLSNLAGLETFVNTLIERGRHRLTPGEVCYLRQDVHAIFFASKALAKLAGAPGNPADPPDPKCTPKPGPLGTAAPYGRRSRAG
jgi:hypothetical protein